MRRILILSGLQISTNPRVMKEANTLSAAGFDVEVAGATLQRELLERDRFLTSGAAWRYTPLLNSAATNSRGRLQWVIARARRRAWQALYDISGIANARQLGYVAPEMLRYALDQKPDLTILHNPQSLWVGAELLRRGRPVAVDVEDWYSEDHPPERPQTHPRRALRSWEMEVLQGARYASAPSARLSEALTSSFGCSPPAVIYNAFPWKERLGIDELVIDRIDEKVPSVCWFSQVIGPGRGLETLMGSLHTLRGLCEIHIRGSGSPVYHEELLAMAPPAWRKRIHFHPQTPHNELISRLAEHDIGFAGDLPYCRSRDLTITNKILQYLLAGNAVVASSTAGHEEVATAAGSAVMLYRAGDPASLAAVLDSFLENPEMLASARRQAIVAAKSVFSWERYEPQLVKLVEKAVA